MQTSTDMSVWNELSRYLRRRSREICKDNGCARDEHHCESYAYISQDGELHDICCSDYWQGWGSSDEERHGQCAAVMLPWHGTGRDLMEEVDTQCWE